MALQMVTAGESHGPALAAIVTGLPAGLQLHKEAIDADLRRRQQGYGRSPRQKLESDEVEVLSVKERGDEITVRVRERTPALDDRVEARVTHPYRLLSLPAGRDVVVDWLGR